MARVTVEDCLKNTEHKDKFQLIIDTIKKIDDNEEYGEYDKTYHTDKPTVFALRQIAKLKD